MNCPRCEEGILVERVREGVVIDGCPTCRGVWLDRGEMEKLIARAMTDLEEHWDDEPEYPPRHARGDRPPPGAGYPPVRRKSTFKELLGSLFD